MNLAARIGLGAAFGAYTGTDNGKQGMFAGAIAGGAAGAFAPKAIGWAGKKIGGTEWGAKAFGQMNKAQSWLGNAGYPLIGKATGLMNKGVSKFEVGGNARILSGKAANGISNGMFNLSSSLRSNRFGGQAATALGVGSMGLIGSSLLGSSNRSY